MSKSSIVLDLDETLVHSMDGMEVWHQLNLDPELAPRLRVVEMHDVVTPKGTGLEEKMWLVMRPHLHEFLTEIRKRFDYVIVWSAGKYEYVHDLVTRIFPYEPDHIFTSNDIYNKEGFGCKPFSTVQEKFPDIDVNRSVVIDDKYHTFWYNPGIGLLIPEYDPGPTKREILEDDNTLTNILELFKISGFPRTTIHKLDLQYFILQPDELHLKNQ